MSYSLIKLKWLFSWKAGNGQGLQRGESKERGILAECGQTSGIKDAWLHGNVTCALHQMNHNTHTHTYMHEYPKHILETVLPKHSETSEFLVTENQPSFKALRRKDSVPLNFNAGDRQVLALTVGCKSFYSVSLYLLSKSLLSPLAFCVGD